MKKISVLIFISCCISLNVEAQKSESKPQIITLETPTDASLRGLHALSESIVWVSGSKGTYLRSIDGGLSWKHGSIVDSLDFRDVYAFDQDHAIVISAGYPATIFKTKDGGDSWDQVYSNYDERVFFDAIDFWDDKSGIAFSDSFDGTFFMIITKDGGDTWTQLASAPEALEGEGGFAASGTNMIISRSSGSILLGTTTGRLLKSYDKGETWTVIQSLIESSKPTSGIFSVAAYKDRVLIVGGDYMEEKNTDKNAAYMDPEGNWHLCVQNPPRGFRSAVAYIPDTEMAVCTGTGGTDISFDSGMNWSSLSEEGFHAISYGKSKNSGWMSGSSGRIAKILWPEN